MENNTIQIEITEQDENNGVLTSMHKELDSLNISFYENWCIYKVPEHMLKGHEYFYQPLFMSIGPVFYKDPKLEPMQKVKWIYLNSFLRLSKNACQSLNPYIEYVRGKEEEIRRCYEQEFKLCSDEFVKMIVLDAAFLVYYFLSKIFPDDFDKPLAGNNLDAQMSNAYYDLFRLENQIPYFVVKGFFDIAFGGNICIRPNALLVATIFLCSIETPGIKAIRSIIEGNKITYESNIQHLLDLRRMCCCLSLSTPLHNQPNTNPTTDLDSYVHKVLSLICPSPLYSRLRKRHPKTETVDYHSFPRLCYTAKQLYDAGVTFVAGETDNPLDVTFANGILTISKLKIYDDTESRLRNLVYFEQCHYKKDSYFIGYIFFLDDMIDTVEDVQVLVKNRIFSNHLGSDDDVVKLFNNIGKNVLGSYKLYSNVSNAVNCYASNRRHRWMAILRSKYFNHPWTILSVIAAIILFVLTLLQTIAVFIYK